MTHNYYEMNIFTALHTREMFIPEYSFCREIGSTSETQQSSTSYHRKSFAEWQGVNFHK